MTILDTAADRLSGGKITELSRQVTKQNQEIMLLDSRLQESMQRLEQLLYAPGWQRIGMQAEDEFTRDGLRQIVTLARIMRENILPQFTHEFAGEGLMLTITDAAVDHVVEDCLRRGTGARGLHAEGIVAVENAAYENFMQNKNAEVLIDVKDDRLETEVRER